MQHGASRQLIRSTAQTRMRRRGRLALFVWSAAICVVWLIILPELSNRVEMRQRAEFLESRGIDPSAMFYTELDAVDPLLDRLERYHRDHAARLWLPTRADRSSSIDARADDDAR